MQQVDRVTDGPVPSPNGSPSDGHAYGASETQEFSVHTFDAEGDPWSAHVTVTDSVGAQTTFVVPSTNGFDAIGTPPQPFPPGSYTWTATAVDSLGASSAPTEVRGFSVNP